MKKTLLFLICAIFALNINAQKLKKRFADKAYSRFHYVDAINYYNDLILKDSSNVEIKEKLALCYKKINDAKYSEYWFRQIINKDGLNPLDKLYFAQVLAKNKKYDEAKVWYSKYAAVISKDSRGNAFTNAYNNINQFYHDSLTYITQPVEYNSIQRDFSTSYYLDGFVFCSNRERYSFIKNIFPWDNSDYLDLYFTKGDSASVKRLRGKINTKYHEGPIAFDKTGDTAIFTRTNYFPFKLKYKFKPIENIKMFKAVKIDGKWKQISEISLDKNEGTKPLNIFKKKNSFISANSSSNYSYGHPCFSPDGTKLFFISNKAGGFGGTDIYYCDYKNGILGEPVNLGDTINTEGNEMFPFVDSLNNIYYSSDGLAGLGGLDIFLSKYSKGKYGKPVNLGSPINSNEDDFGFICQDFGNEGYFSSNRGDDFNDDNIYHFIRTSKRINLLVLNKKNNMPIDSASIIFKGKKLSPVTIITDINGKNQTLIVPKTDYSLVTSKNYFINDTSEFTAGYLNKSDEIKVFLTEKKKITFYVYNSKTNQPISSVSIILTSNNINDTLITDNSGNKQIYLEPAPEYTLLVSKDGYVSQSLNYKVSDINTKDVIKIPLVKINELTLFVYDSKTKLPIDSATILIEKSNSTNENYITDKSGKHLIKVEPKTGYKLIVNRNNYKGDTLSYSDVELDKMEVMNIPLIRKNIIITLIGNVYKDKDKKPFFNANITLRDTVTGAIITAKSDKNGDFKYTLQPDKEYTIEINGNIKRGKCNKRIKKLSTKGIPESIVIYSNFALFCVGDIIKVENILYDVDKYDIRPDAALELDKLIEVLNDLPTMKIELRSHTDSRGSDAYNLKLSDNRAKAVVDYLISKGISQDRLIAKGYGETIPLNKCKNRVRCSENEHQVNRRTEFKVLSIE